MPRRRYYRSRRTFPKPKWSINTNTYVGSAGATNAQCITIADIPLIENPSRNNAAGNPANASAQILKAARIKIKGVILSGMAAGQTCLAAIMYIPENITATAVNTAMGNQGNTIFYCHPEWLMGWTRMDYTNAAQRNEFSITSRLKRNLNPGDKISLVVYNINNTAGGVAAIDVATTCSYCVRAN